MKAFAKRAIVVGMDGASMEIVRNMVQWGHAPNLKRLMETGAWRPMIGVFPTLTPPGWTAVSTGSWPGTHGVMDFNIRALGKPLTETVWGINTALSRSEYLWNATERAGKLPILVKWEMSWPPTVTTGIQVEGTGPGVSNYHQIAGYHLWVAGRWAARPIGGQRDPETLDPSALQTMREVDPVQLRPIEPGSWANLPSSQEPPLEVELVVRPLARGRTDQMAAWGTEGAVPRTFHGLVYARSSAGYDRVLVSETRDAGRAIADLGVGEWSDWSRQRFTIGGRDLTGYMRLKLITLTPTADMFELFMPQIWPNEGYTKPADIARAIDEHVGPFLQNPARDALGVFDDQTYFELLDIHHGRLADVAHYLGKSRDWDLLMTETHASDYSDHFFLGQAEPFSGASPETVERCRRGMIETFASIDRWIGRLLELRDDETLFVVVSDHGGTPNQFRAVDIAQVLEQAGFLVRDPATGAPDLSKSVAVNVGLVHVFINLKGREPNGIVDPADYEKVQREIIQVLHDYTDPTTGRRPFALAVSRANAEMVNLWGDLVGDVVYALHPEFDGAHGKQLPSVSFGMGGQHSTFIISGPNVKKGVALQRQVRCVDVAPTIAYLLGMEPPRNAEGGVVYEALEEIG